ncbi:hypothetical protein R5R35_012032 [Gryllus longicercus]|uniref:Uncharacterized protein n=1 Tax=Gryllus longicercus TaxID=2509291 RepID=A0AAN9Z5C4_9ORTH
MLCKSPPQHSRLASRGLCNQKSPQTALVPTCKQEAWRYNIQGATRNNACTETQMWYLLQNGDYENQIPESTQKSL